MWIEQIWFRAGVCAALWDWICSFRGGFELDSLILRVSICGLSGSGFVEGWAVR